VEVVLGVETERVVGFADTGVFAETMTEGIDGSCEWDEFELAILLASEASTAVATSISRS
jgi:hypothetical protein